MEQLDLSSVCGQLGSSVTDHVWVGSEVIEGIATEQVVEELLLSDADFGVDGLHDVPIDSLSTRRSRQTALVLECVCEAFKQVDKWRHCDVRMPEPGPRQLQWFRDDGQLGFKLRQEGVVRLF